MIVSFFISTFLECLKERPDIFHGHWAFPGGFIAFVMSKIFSRKFIVTIHGGEIAPLKKSALMRRLVIYSLNKSSFVIANSNYTKDQIMQLGVKNEKIIKVNVPPNFVNHTSDNKFLKQFRNRFASGNHKVILFVGRLTELKGVEYLIRSLLEIKTVKLHLIVVGDGMLSEDLRNLTKLLDLENRVTFFGGANREELGCLYDVSDVFVLPSIVDSKGATEGLGLTIIEAMESGLPVIATSVGGIEDNVKHEMTGLLVNQKDPVGIARAIERIMSDNELRKKVVENSREVVKKYMPQAIAKQYYCIFESLINKEN